MATNTARMERAAQELARCGVAFSRFEAVSGRALSAEDLVRVYDSEANKKRARHSLIAPEIGCYLSHVALWQRIAESDAPGAVILEDDFAAADDLDDVLRAVAEDAGDWELVKLFSARVTQKMLDCRSLGPGRSIGVPYKVPNTTLGYAIRREAAARLAAAALPVSRPIDEDHKHFWELGLRLALVVPSPLSFGAHSTEAGTITADRKRLPRQSFPVALWQGWRTVRFRLNYLVNLHWHRLMPVFRRGPR